MLNCSEHREFSCPETVAPGWTRSLTARKAIGPDVSEVVATRLLVGCSIVATAVHIEDLDTQAKALLLAATAPVDGASVISFERLESAA
jgi:hypothetical protein